MPLNEQCQMYGDYENFYMYALCCKFAIICKTFLTHIRPYTWNSKPVGSVFVFTVPDPDPAFSRIGFFIEQSAFTYSVQTHIVHHFMVLYKLDVE